MNNDTVTQISDPIDEWLKRLSSPEYTAEADRRSKEAEIEERRRLQESHERRFVDLCPSELRCTDWDDSRLKNYRAQIDRIRSWQIGRRGLYAMGRSGRGKSRAFWDLVHRLIREGRSVRVVKQTEVTRLLNRDPAAFLDAIDSLHRCSVMCWDDFGKFEVMASRNDVLLGELEALIDARSSNGRPMIFTSNCTTEDVLERFGQIRGEPILRRITESCDVLDFGWK